MGVKQEVSLDLNHTGKADGLRGGCWRAISRWVSRTMLASVVVRGNVESIADVNGTPTPFSQHRDHYGGLCIVRV
jgi:hypothetical protein